MRILQFTVSGQSLKKEGDFSGIVAGTNGYLQTSYNFDNDWKDCKKAAIFSRYDKDYPVPIINGRCEVPEEVTGCKSNIKFIFPLPLVNATSSIL